MLGSAAEYRVPLRTTPALIGLIKREIGFWRLRRTRSRDRLHRAPELLHDALRRPPVGRALRPTGSVRG